MYTKQIRYTVKYQVATYSGEVTVICDEDDDNEQVTGQAKAQLRRDSGGFLPYGYESFKIIDSRVLDY